MKKTVLVVVGLVWLGGRLASAQTPTPPTSVDILVLPQGADPATGTPVATLTTPIGVAQNCGLTTAPPPPTGPLVNPTKAVFDDPFTPGRFCMVNMPTNVPNGTGYFAVAVPIAPTCSPNGVALTPCPGPRSLAGTPPFSVQPILGRPAVLTGLGVRP